MTQAVDGQLETRQISLPVRQGAPTRNTLPTGVQ